MSDQMAVLVLVGCLAIVVLLLVLGSRWRSLSGITRANIGLLILIILAVISPPLYPQIKKGFVFDPSVDLLPVLGGLAWLIAGAVGFCVYLLPAFIATRRKHPNVAPIIIVNIFLGWTFLGWIVALAWSASAGANRKAGPS
jgi:hypothetical protein